jgi:hypothetical protein
MGSPERAQNAASSSTSWRDGVRRPCTHSNRARGPDLPCHPLEVSPQLGQLRGGRGSYQSNMPMIHSSSTLTNDRGTRSSLGSQRMPEQHRSSRGLSIQLMRSLQPWQRRTPQAQTKPGHRSRRRPTLSGASTTRNRTQDKQRTSCPSQALSRISRSRRWHRQGNHRLSTWAKA